jgi:hypothetical protein
MSLSAITARTEEPFEPTVEPSRFQGPNDRFPGGWLEPATREQLLALFNDWAHSG